MVSFRLFFGAIRRDKMAYFILNGLSAKRSCFRLDTRALPRRLPL